MNIARITLAILMLPLVSGVAIETVYYNAFQESGSEFIRLYNPDSDSVDLTDWTIRTPTSQADATLQGTIPGESYFLITDAGWNEKKDDISWPNADYEETLTLPNTAGYVQLIDAQGVIHDTVGYGGTTISDGSPYPGAAEGLALVRQTSTQDNSVDFLEQTPLFSQEESLPDSGIAFQVSIIDSPPKIIDILVEDADPREGIQIFLSPETNRTIPITVIIEDNNTVANTTVHVNNISLRPEQNSTQANYTGTITISHDTPYLQVHVQDGTHTIKRRIDLEFVGLSSLDFPNELFAQVAPGQAGEATIPITNKGASPVLVRIGGITPKRAGEPIGEIAYTLFGETYPLTHTLTLHDTPLDAGEHADMHLYIQAAHTTPGNFFGQILVMVEQA